MSFEGVSILKVSELEKIAEEEHAIVLFHEEGAESRDVVSMWSRLSRKVPTPTFYSCGTGPKGAPFAAVYRNGKEIRSENVSTEADVLGLISRTYVPELRHFEPFRT